jgi:hypothetical protein
LPIFKSKIENHKSKIFNFGVMVEIQTTVPLILSPTGESALEVQDEQTESP